MLVLTRKHRQAIVLATSDGPVRIEVVGGTVKLAMQLPDTVRAVRAELLELECEGQRGENGNT